MPTTSITNTILNIIKEPLTYFSEADIQQLLVEELRKIPYLSKLYPTSVQRGKDSKSTYNTSLLHREYGGGEGSRIDIVIFDPEDVKNINNINLTIDNNYLSPLYAFELGTEKTSDTKAHFENDIKKLEKCKHTGYLIHIYKDITSSASGTKSREKTEERIKTNFKDAFTNPNPKIKVLAILLRIYRQQQRIIGKCEIYSKGEWIKVNINDPEKLKEIILGELE